MSTLAYRDETAEGFVIEFFMPKRLDYVSQTYALLREELRRAIRGRAMPPNLYGFSIYEVDGAFIGEPGIMEDRTMVVRVFFEKKDLDEPELDLRDSRRDLDPLRMGRLRRKVNQVMGHLARISKSKEEEIWAF